MFESFRKFLAEVSQGRKQPAHFEHNDYRLVAAALLVAIRVLGALPGAERRLERRLFPLRAAVVRGKWDYYQCGTPCWAGRTPPTARR